MSNKKAKWFGAGLALTVLSMLAPISLGAGSAEAAVYCTTAGVPDGCVARPAAAAGAPGRFGVAGVGAGAPGVGVRAGAGAGAPGVAGVAGVGAGAQGAGIRAGTPMNRGGQVNRAGRR